MSKATREFVPLSDAALRAVSGPNSRHIALIEDALHVLIETPGGGVSVSGDARARTAAKRAIQSIAARADDGLDVSEADIRVAARGGEADDKPRSGGGARLPAGKRGAIAAKTAAQARYLDLLSNHELVFGVGPAGTGKTFLAVAHGAGMLLRGEVDRLIVTRPAVEAGERLGFLPGDMNEKVDPYMAPVWEALSDILGAEQLRRRRERGEIEVAPIAFMRGRTLNQAFVIGDEAQNTSRLQMKMVLTRLGEGARMAVTGDPSEVDLVNSNDSGLSHAVRILDGVKGVAVARFEASDVVRHPLVERIVKAYDADTASEGQRMIEVEIADPAWEDALPVATQIAEEAAAAAIAAASDGDAAHAGDLVILLTDDAQVKDLNARFRGKDAATNVLSFPAPPNAQDHIGDIALAYGVCAHEAAAQGKSLADHLRHLTIHGVLHLFGYDHEIDSEAEAMETLERRILAGLGVADPYADGPHADDADHG